MSSNVQIRQHTDENGTSLQRACTSKCTPSQVILTILREDRGINSNQYSNSSLIDKSKTCFPQNLKYCAD